MACLGLVSTNFQIPDGDSVAAAAGSSVVVVADSAAAAEVADSAAAGVAGTVAAADCLCCSCPAEPALLPSQLPATTRSHHLLSLNISARSISVRATWPQQVGSSLTDNIPFCQ